MGEIGQPLPDPFRVFGKEKIHFRRGATSMIAGKPGSFKSILALNMVVTWATRYGIRTQYFSADADEGTVIRRLSSIITGDNSDIVESRMIRKETGKYEKALAALEGVEFEYEQMDFETMAYRVKSFESIYGAFPDVIVLDNLIDFISNPMAWDEMQMLIKDLDGLSKEISSHICILHHAKLDSEGTGSGKKPKPMGQPPADWEIQGKVTQFPRLALTMAASALNVNVACVKNTNGPQYRDATRQLGFVVLQSMQVRETAGSL